MISMTTISSAGGCSNYMTQQAATEYYAGQAVPSAWEGKGAEIQGLSGEVKAEDLTKQLEGNVTEINKSTGVIEEKQLGVTRGGELQHRAGWDLTFAAPKSVSIESEVFGNADVRAAWEESVREGMAFLESKAAQARIGGEMVNTGNLTYGTFSHATSRAGDPQTHTHVIVANVTYDKDGKAYSLSNEKLMESRHAADQVCKNALGNKLEALGYEVQWDKKGDLEITGYSRDQIEIMSKRTEQMNAALIEKGINPAFASNAARQAAVLDTRADKDHPESADAHRDRWQAEAKANGINPAERNGKGIHEASSADKAVAQAVAHLTEREMAFKEKDLYFEAAKFCQGKADTNALFKAIDAAKASGELIERTDGKFTTKDAINCEKEIAEHLNAGRGAHESVMTKKEFDKALAAFEERKGFALGSEQRAAASMILCQNDRFQGVQGLAGTGKTTMLEFVREAAESRGWEVRGMSNGGAQADKLQEESGIKSQTTASFLIEFQKLERDANLAQRALDTFEKRNVMNEPNFKQLMADVKAGAGNVSLEKDSGGRQYFTDRAGNTYNKDLYGKAGKMESRNLNHLGLTSSTYNLTDSGVYKSGGTLTSELASKLHDKAAEAGAQWSGKATSSMMNWQKATPAEALIVRTAIVNKSIADMKARAGALKDTPQKTLYLGDEASMSGARETRDIINATEKTGARHVALGDEKQHQSVAAGGKTFEQSQQHMPMSYLGAESIQRQKTDHAKATVADVLAGKHQEATAGLPTKQVSNAQDVVRDKFEGKDVTGKDKTVFNAEMKEAAKVDNKAVISAIAKDYSSMDRGARDKTLVISASNADRKAINNEVRDNLKAQGELKDGKAMTTLEPSKLSATELKLASNFEKEQKIEFTSQYKNVGVAKGEKATVTGMDSRTNTVTAKTESGKEIKFNPEKVTGINLSTEQKDKEFAVGDKVAFTKNEEKFLNVKNGQTGTVEKFDGKTMTVKLDGKAAVGDKVVFNRDDKALGIKAGQTGTVEKTDSKTMTVKLDNGQTYKLDKEQSKNVSPTREFKADQYKHVDHAYAVTSFKSQGQTVNNVIVHHNTEGGKHGDRETYVNYTRAREDIKVYTQNSEKAAAQSGTKLDKEVAQIKPEQAKSMATEQSKPTQEQSKPAQSAQPTVQSGAKLDKETAQIKPAQPAKEQSAVKDWAPSKPQPGVSSTEHRAAAMSDQAKATVEKHGVAPEGVKVNITKTDQALGMKAGEKAMVERITDKTVELKLENGSTRTMSINQYKDMTSRDHASTSSQSQARDSGLSSGMRSGSGGSIVRDGKTTVTGTSRDSGSSNSSRNDDRGR